MRKQDQYGTHPIIAQYRTSVIAAGSTMIASFRVAAIVAFMTAITLVAITAPVTSAIANAEDKATADQTTLALNGTAVHTELQLDYYYAALFTESPAADTEALMAQDNLRMELTVLVDDWSKRQFTRYWNQSIAINNSDEAQESLDDDLVKFNQLIKGSLIRGDHIQFEKTAGKGTSISINGVRLIKSKSDNLFALFANVWVGLRPPSSGFKSSILGQTSDINPALITSYQSLKASAKRKTEIKKWAKPTQKKAVAVAAPVKKPKEIAKKPLVIAELRPVGGSEAAPTSTASSAVASTATASTTKAPTSKAPTTSAPTNTVAPATTAVKTVASTAAAETTIKAASPAAVEKIAASAASLASSAPTVNSEAAEPVAKTTTDKTATETSGETVVETTNTAVENETPVPAPVEAEIAEPATAAIEVVVNAEDTALAKPVIEEAELSDETIVAIETSDVKEALGDATAASDAELAIAPPVQDEKGPNTELLQVYRSNLLALTYRNISYPNSAIQRNREGKVVLKVTVNRDGEVKDVSFEEESKFGALNRAANKAVAKSSPFPKIPEGIAGNEIELLVPINFSLSE